MISFVINRCFRNAKDEKRTFPTNDILDTSKLIILFWISADLVFFFRNKTTQCKTSMIDWFLYWFCLYVNREKKLSFLLFHLSTNKKKWREKKALIDKWLATIESSLSKEKKREGKKSFSFSSRLFLSSFLLFGIH